MLINTTNLFPLGKKKRKKKKGNILRLMIIAIKITFRKKKL